MIRSTRRGTLGLVGFLAAVWALSATPGCSFGTEADRDPTSARIIVTGSATPTLQLVISTDFVEQILPETGEIVAVLLVADTVSVATPFERVADLGEFKRVYFRLIEPGATPSAITMQVFLDGALEYEQPATLSQGGALEFRWVSKVFF